MIKTRVLVIKCRYFILVFVLLLVAWQIYENFFTAEKERGRRISTDRESQNVLKAIKEYEKKSQVTISVYYEALCPDSRSFFLMHLLRAYLLMQNALKIELIPYGKAQTRQLEDGNFAFSCQHGSVECFANKIHSCAVHYISKFSLLIRFVSCMIDNNEDPEAIGQQCSKQYNIHWSPILECANNKQGDYLLRKNGELTNNLYPPISFVPTVLLNGNHHNQALVLKNLKKEICSHYSNVIPEECSKLKNGGM